MLEALIFLGCFAIDGDTIRCPDGFRYRLLGIDAPEMSGCQPKRTCVHGDPLASKAALAELIDDKKLTVTIHGMDRYGRPLAMIYNGSDNVNCRLVEQRHAQYVGKWDNDKVLANACAKAR